MHLHTNTPPTTPTQPAPQTPTLAEFRRVYYDRELDYWDIADTFGVDRWRIDEWRRAFRLPSRRVYGTRRNGHPEDNWEDPSPHKWEHYSGSNSQYYLWD